MDELNEYVEGPPEISQSLNPEKNIAISAAKSLFSRIEPVIARDKDNMCGVVVWCLTSSTNNNVQYHMDYAELFRYETNQIHPPLYGGIVQLSPFESGEMEGGDFMLNTDGINHYRKFGYKGTYIF